jgi:nitrite reductase/ring-hydroxylating ferredoxin subunit
MSEAPQPGTVHMVDVGSLRIGVFCLGDQYYALADRCPHRGAPVCSRGEVVTPIEVRGLSLELGEELSVLRCPWHKWDYEIATGRCLVDPKLRIRRYAVSTDKGGNLVINLAPPTSRVKGTPSPTPSHEPIN